MLDEFLGGGGHRQPLRQAQAERLEPKGKFVSARRDILLTMLRGVTGQGCPAPAKSEGPPRRMAQTSGTLTQKGGHKCISTL